MAMEQGFLITVAAGGNAPAMLDMTAASATALSDTLERLIGIIEQNAASADVLAGSVDNLAFSMGAATATTDEDTAATEANSAAKEGGAVANDAFAASAKRMMMPLGLGAAAIIGIGAASLVMQSKFESAMSVVEGLAAPVGTNMTVLKAQVLAMAQAYGAAPDKLAQGLYYILSAQIPVTQAMGVLKAVTMASGATFVDQQADADALTSAMNAYGVGANKAMLYQDYLTTAVKDGKTSMDLYAPVVAKVMTTAAAAGVGIDQASAAMAGLTANGMKARLASNDLAFLIRALDINTDHLALTAQKMGLTFDENHFKTLKFNDQLTYLMQITHGNQSELLKLTGGAAGWLAMMVLMGKGHDKYVNAVKDMATAQGATARAWAVHTQTIGYAWDKMKSTLAVALIQLGHAIEPLAVALLGKLSPAFAAIGDWISHHGQQAVIIFGTLAAILGGAFLIAIGGVVGGFIAANAAILPFIAIGMAVAGVVALVATHWKQVQPYLWPVIDAVQRYLIPAFKQLLPVLGELKPLLGVIAVIIGGVLILALGMLVGTLTGLIRGFSAFLSGAILFGQGLIHVIGGAFAFIGDLIGGAMQVIGDILSGNWSKAFTDSRKQFEKLKGDLGQILQGLWEMIRGAFQAGIGFIVGLVSGFVGGILGFFGHLRDELIGHSIIPDMIRDIILAFGNLELQVLGIVGGMIGKLIGTMLAGGAHVVAGLTAGIQNAVPGLKGVVAGAAQAVKNFWPFSPAKEGPLVGWENVGGHMMQMLATSMQGATGTIARSAQNAASTVSTGYAAGQGGGSTDVLLGRILNQLQRSGTFGPGNGAGALAGVPQSTTNNWGGISVNGVQNINQLAAQITQIQGIVAEMGGRGMVGGWALQ